MRFINQISEFLLRINNGISVKRVISVKYAIINAIFDSSPAYTRFLNATLAL